ncbi:MAG: Gfo/Idh/MocA family oxidoreductase [Balneolales bacterium]
MLENFKALNTNPTNNITMDKEIRIGIIGYGKMGQIRAKHFERKVNCEIAGVYDICLPPEVNYPVASSPDALIADPTINAIVICLPNFLIKPTTIAALEAGKNVFCEKPPALNMTEMQEIASAKSRSAKILMYGFNHRRHAAVIKMKELVDSGEMGRILWMRGRYGKSVDSNYLNGWRAEKRMAGGGILLDQGIHMLDLFLHIGNQTFDEVHAMVSSLYWQTEGIEDNVFAIMRNSVTGMCAQLHSTMTQWRHLFSLEVFMEEGYMVLNGLKTNSGTYGDEILTIARNRTSAPAAAWQAEERLEFKINTSWENEAEDFIMAIQGSSSLQHGTVQDAINVMQLIEDIYNNDTHISNSLKTT